MTFKINISEKSGKTYHLESESEELIGKELHNKVNGKDISGDLEGYEFEITGASDNAGFTAIKNVEGVGLKKVLLTYGKAMHKRPRKEGKKKVSNPKPKGLRLRKTVRGKVISPAIVQINLKVTKEGSKKLSEIFPEQCKPRQKAEAPKEETKTEEQKPVEKKEEVKEEKPKDAEAKEEGAKEKEKKEEQELAQPEKEPVSEKVEKEG